MNCERVRIVQNMYGEARMQVRSGVEVTGWISVKVSLHQGSSQSQYLFVLMMNVLALGVRLELLNCLRWFKNGSHICMDIQ